MSKQEVLEELEEIKRKIEPLITKLLDGVDFSRIAEGERVNLAIRLIGILQRNVDIKITNQTRSPESRNATVITAIMEYMRGDFMEPDAIETTGSTLTDLDEET